MLNFAKLLLAPSKDQLLFIKMLFRNEKRFWEKWLNENEIEEIESWIFFFIPQIYLIIKQLGIESRFNNKMYGIYKKSLYRNQLFLSEIAKLNLNLKEQCIEVTFLTEIMSYSINTNRYLKSIDILLKKENKIIELIENAGWKRITETTFKNSLDFKLEIKWENDKNSIIKENTKVIILDEKISLNTIDKETAMVLLSSNSNYTDPQDSISWLYDIKQIILSSSDLNWNKIFSTANKLALPYNLKLALEYLNEKQFIKNNLDSNINEYLNFNKQVLTKNRFKRFIKRFLINNSLLRQLSL